MSEFNFDKMKNVEIPDSWVDGALNVEKEPKTPFPFLKYSKIVAFAASIVLVCSLSIAFFFITNSKKAVPSVKVQETVFSSEVQNYSENFESTENVAGKNEKIDDDSTQAESQKSEETAEPSEYSENPTEKEETKSEKPEKPKPTQKVEKPTKPTKPIPTENATEPVLEVPPDGPFVEPDANSSYVESYSSGKIVAKVYKDDISYEIYCRIYDNNGNMIGNDNLYSNSKRAGIVMSTESGEGTEANYNLVEYDTAKLGTNLSVGSYYVVFYDNSGKDICNGYIYVRGK